jgi:hypothetical protein
MVTENPRSFLDVLRSAGMSEEITAFEPMIDRMAEYLPNNHEALMRFALGLHVVAEALAEKPKYRNLGVLYQMLASIAYEKAMENGYDQVKYPPRNYNQDFTVGDQSFHRDQVLTKVEAKYLSEYYRDHGLKVGLIHGHFRLLTPSSIAFIINACVRAQVVFVGIELGERTQKFKGKDPIFTDAERDTIFRQLTPFVFSIDNSVPYSNAGYQELCATIHPDIYFGQSDEPEPLKKAKLHRAAAVGCTYLELTNLPGLSTTEMKAVIDSLSSDD